MTRILADRLGGTGVASWTEPKGGYFVSLEVVPGTASRVVELAKAAGIALTPAGARSPTARTRRTRSSASPRPSPIEEVRVAMDGVATCVLLAAAEHAAK